MAKLTSIYEFLEYKAPKALSEEWDNDGIMVMGEDKNITKILCCLDLTSEVADHALAHGYELIITHHPLIFHPLKSVNDPMIVKLIQAGVSVFSFHTRLDATNGGVNDTLCDILGLESISTHGLMRVGELPMPMSSGEFAELLKSKLSSEKVTSIVRTSQVQKVAVLTGAGKDEYDDAVALGVDTYLTGEMSYSTMIEANKGHINVFEAGHFETEFPICETLRKWLLEYDFTLKVDTYRFCPIRTM